jgi:Uma2 family endonuclease
MTAEAFGGQLPAVVTLDDLAVMNASDQHGHRFELSPEGALTVMPPPDSGHAAMASRILVWLAIAGWPAEHLLQAAGIRIPGARGTGGRIPDLTVWAAPPPRAVWCSLTGLVLVVEIVSPGSAPMDQLTKVREYAAAGIPRYWVVDRDEAQTVTLYTLGDAGGYEPAAKMPLAWLLRTAPGDHLPLPV